MLYKYFRRFKKRLLIKIFGVCFINGHSFKMMKGWKSNPDWDPEVSEKLTGNAFSGMCKDWIYYKCRRCPQLAEKIREPK